jgi:hypothetical protein
MYRPTGATKRQKEIARQEYQKEKQAKKEQRKREKAEGVPESGENPATDSADTLPGIPPADVPVEK